MRADVHFFRTLSDPAGSNRTQNSSALRPLHPSIAPPDGLKTVFPHALALAISVAAFTFAITIAPVLAQQTPGQPSSAATPASQPAPVQPTPLTLFTQQQLEALLGPVALYSDSLLAQVLPATAYPLEIVEAARFAEVNKAALDRGDFSGVDAQNWDPSVKALTRFPTVLAKLNKDLQWTSDLGDAFVAQPKDVVDAIQTLRARAQRSGALKSTKQQTIVTRPASSGGGRSGNIIAIQDADPGVVYVPEYDPGIVYGNGAALAAGAIGFVGGVAVGAAIADNYWDWHGGWVYPPRWPGYPGYRPWNNNTFINTGDITINGHNIINPVRPWRPDPARFHPSNRLQNAISNRSTGTGPLARGGAAALPGTPRLDGNRPDRNPSGQQRLGQGGAGTRNPAIAQRRAETRPGQGAAGQRRATSTRPGQHGAGTRVQRPMAAAHRSVAPRANAFSGINHGRAAMAFSGRGVQSRFEGFGGGFRGGEFGGVREGGFGGFRGGGFGGGFHGGGRFRR